MRTLEGKSRYPVTVELELGRGVTGVERPTEFGIIGVSRGRRVGLLLHYQGSRSEVACLMRVRKPAWTGHECPRWPRLNTEPPPRPTIPATPPSAARAARDRG